ncbi:MAG: hypothetical protein J7480_01595 [Microbacteriaceae bacterium]|nr:hypothetical protein [Microbacteriaceae bacterium]
MIRRRVAWVTGLVLAAAGAAGSTVPAAPALAADPLPPCFPSPEGGLAQPLVPDPATGQLTLPAVPLVTGLLRLPGVVYCDPGLPLPELIDGQPILPGLPPLDLPDVPLPPIPVPELPPLPGPMGPVVDGVLDPVLGGVPVLEVPLPGEVAAAAPVVLDEEAPLFTQPAAQAGADSISISGLQSVSIVKVRTSSGEVPVVRILADAVAMDGFMLDVRPSADSAAAVNDSARLELNGHVRVYLQSLTATGPGGLAINLLAPTPVPGDELPPALVRATFGLVGATADSSVWADTHLRIVE